MYKAILKGETPVGVIKVHTHIKTDIKIKKEPIVIDMGVIEDRSTNNWDEFNARNNS